jgi:hypothetical protein
MPKITREEFKAAFERNGRSLRATAKELGMRRSTARGRALRMGLTLPGGVEKQETETPVTFPDFPAGDLPTAELISTMSKRFAQRWKRAKAKNWFPLKVNIKGPIAVSWWGDPHLDDNGCNWPLLEHHIELHRDTEGLFSVNIGDWINNWVGSLIRLYAEQSASFEDAKAFAEWFLNDSGVDWIAIIFGNHDGWTDFPNWLRAKALTKVPMEDWQARFRLVFPNGREVRCWAAHNFPGNSMWNSLHGPQKAAHTKSEAHIYACGDLHNWAIHQEESASRDFTYWLIRSRGYKFIDSHATQLGHFPQAEGATITTVINPDAKSESGLVQAFADMDAAVDYLKWARKH